MQVCIASIYVHWMCSDTQVSKPGPKLKEKQLSDFWNLKMEILKVLMDERESNYVKSTTYSFSPEISHYCVT